MGLIADLQPTNLEEEKAKFFQDFSYNPQFVYVRDFSDEELKKYGLPKQEYFEHAKRMLETHGTFQKTDKPVLTQEEIKKSITTLTDKLKIKPIDTYFISNQTGRVILIKNIIKFRLPIKIKQIGLESILNHEIQTHYLRKINDAIQKLNTQVMKNPLFRKTEEGLANLHSFINRENKIIKKTYQTYVAVYWAQKKSFSEVFFKLINLGLSDEVAWAITLKQKRGLKDTSQPGGFTKDLAYFEGIVDVWNWIQNLNNDPRDLYLGRISMNEVSKIKLITDPSKSIYPTFFENMEMYKKNVAKIGSINKFSDLIN